MFDLSLSPLLELETSIAPLPDRPRLLAQPPLTACPASGNLSFPKLRRLAEAFASVPALARNTAFPVSATNAPLGWCGYISAEQRPVSVRTGGLLSAGERCSVFFVPCDPSQN